MSIFMNMRISAKVISLFCLLGTVVVLITFFATNRMKHIDDVYSTMLDSGVKSTITLFRANVRTADTTRLAYTVIAEQNPEQKKKAVADMKVVHDEWLQFVGKAREALPKQAARMTELTRRYEALFDVIHEIQAAALANDDPKALALLHDRFNPAMAPVRAEVWDIVQASDKDLDGESADTTTTTNTTVAITYASVALSLVLVMSLAVVLTNKGISRPIVRLSEAMRRLAERDYTVAIEGDDRRDELGTMARAVTVFKEGMQRSDSLAEEQKQAQQARETRANHIEQITKRFDSTVASIIKALADAARKMQATASNMSSTAEQTSSQASNVATAARQAASNVQTVAAASEELASSIGEIGRQVNQSSDVAASAREQSEHTNGIVQGLAQSAQRIGEVVAMINDISSQTNLLALNATIEAARAGAAGKGFAVVAGEVKALANQTGKATDEIAQQISAVQAATEEAVQAIQGIGDTIHEINQISTTIASAVEQQGAATHEIARNVQEAATGTQDVTQNITGVSDAAISTGHAANDVLNAATELSRYSENLQKVVQTFLSDVRAA
ncbi:methyl-accepting chemotaxis protein [Telmatospirillum sp.]|uniref:methyl-accepting chemotaxis protein n=1 Tax=Telmatospirillum sp. TaxID=2079197 RepID=UPI00284481B2|nr:methyl-accepting chemotaxis protein [Telmatospirillum sp.]MDR3438557.1 methyl-accepting chemotaxis protein [Telmatospirillum sp.]